MEQKTLALQALEQASVQQSKMPESGPTPESKTTEESKPPAPKVEPPSSETISPANAEVEAKIEELSSTIQQTREEIQNMQEQKVSQMTEQFEDIYHRQLQELLPTVSSYFDKIRYAGLIEMRDEEWKKLMETEISNAEQYYEQKTKQEISLVEAKVMAEMKQGHAEDLDRLTALMQAANAARDDQVQNITNKVLDIQESQNKMLSNIDRLKSIHHLHGILNRLQKCLTNDPSQAQAIFAELLGLGDDFVKHTTRYTLEKVNPDKILSLMQLQEDFVKYKTRARHELLMPTYDAWGCTFAYIADFLIPKSIHTIDKDNTLHSLRSAESKLLSGDLRSLKSQLEPLQDKLNKDTDANTEAFLAKIQARLDVATLITVLMAYNNSRFKDVIS